MRLDSEGERCKGFSTKDIAMKELPMFAPLADISVYRPWRSEMDFPESDFRTH